MVWLLRKKHYMAIALPPCPIHRCKTLSSCSPHGDAHVIEMKRKTYKQANKQTISQIQMFFITFGTISQIQMFFYYIWHHSSNTDAFLKITFRATLGNRRVKKKVMGFWHLSQFSCKNCIINCTIFFFNPYLQIVVPLSWQLILPQYDLCWPKKKRTITW